MILIILGVVVLVGVGSFFAIRHDLAMPPRAKVGLTAAGAVVVLAVGSFDDDITTHPGRDLQAEVVAHEAVEDDDFLRNAKHREVGEALESSQIEADGVTVVVDGLASHKRRRLRRLGRSFAGQTGEAPAWIVEPSENETPEALQARVTATLEQGGVSVETLDVQDERPDRTKAPAPDARPRPVSRRQGFAQQLGLLRRP